MSRRSLWVIFCLFILYGTTIPFHFVADHAAVRAKLHGLPLNPLVSADTGRRLSIPDAVQNVLLFLPFGALGVWSVARSRQTAARVLFVTLLGLAFSVAIETLQLFTTDRTTATSDVMTNTIGAFVGAASAGIVGRLGTSLWRRAEARGLTRHASFGPMLAATALVIVAALEPFDVTLELGSVASKVRALQHDVWQAGVLTDEGIASLHYILFTIAVCGWLEAVGVARARIWSAATGIIVAFGLDASQTFITSRMPSLEDAVVRATAALVGVGVWQLAKVRREPALWLSLLTLATFVGAATQQLSPFEIAAVHKPFELMPFLSDYKHTTFETLSHVIELVLLYAPLGFVSQRLLPGRRPLWLVLGATLAIAWPIEWGQGWIVGRYPDVTDLAVSLAGAWLGVRAGTASREFVKFAN